VEEGKLECNENEATQEVCNLCNVISIKIKF